MFKRPGGSIIGQYLQITVGCFITALALDLLLVPNKIAAGGASGIGIILYNSPLHVPVGVTMLLINIPLFVLSTHRLGSVFGVRTFYGAIILSAFTDGLAPFLPVLAKQDPMLAALYGGVLAGIGMGIVFRAGGTTAGTDLAAALLHSYKGIPLGRALFSIDFFVIAGAAVVFRNPELGMYALLSMFLNSYIIDLIVEGPGHTRAAYIICSDPQKAALTIMTELGRGCTGFYGQGKFTGADREILLCVVDRAEIAPLKRIIHKIDPSAFVIMSNVHEVLGEGFKSLSIDLK